MKKLRFSGESHPDSTSLIAKIKSAASVDELIRIEELGGAAAQLAKQRLNRRVGKKKSVSERPSDIVLSEAQLRAKADRFLSQYSGISETEVEPQQFGTNVSSFLTMYGSLNSFWRILDCTSQNGYKAIQLRLGKVLEQDEREDAITSDRKSIMTP